MFVEKVLVELKGQQIEDLDYLQLEMGRNATAGKLSKAAAMRHSLVFYAEVVRAGLRDTIQRKLSELAARKLAAKAAQDLADRQPLSDDMGDPDDLPV